MGLSGALYLARTMRQTHPFVILDLSPAAYAEIRKKLDDAGYSHTFLTSDGRDVIYMQGLAVASESSTRETVQEFRKRMRPITVTWPFNT
jgi:hypothetical protein